MNIKSIVLCGSIFAVVSMCSVALAADAFTVTGKSGSTDVQVNSEVKLKADVVAREKSTENVIVDLEVYDSAKKQVHQEFFENENLGKDKAKSYETSWTPEKPGTYIFKVGVFESGWGKTIYWKDQALKIVAKDKSAAPQKEKAKDKEVTQASSQTK